MIPWATFPLFAVSAVVVILAPGPDTLYIASRSIAQGRAAGIVSACGIFAGLMVHLTLATLGLSAFLASSLLLFTVVKLAGAAYLVFLGARLMMAKQPTMSPARAGAAPLASVFRQGAITNILNPKVALFFVAFLPQFVVARLGHIPLQIASMGLMFACAGTAWNMVTATVASAIGALLLRNAWMARVQQKLAGIVFVGLGVRMALVTRG